MSIDIRALRAEGATMSVVRAGEALGLSRASAYRAANASPPKLPVIRIGRRVRVRTDALIRMIDPDAEIEPVPEQVEPVPEPVPAEQQPDEADRELDALAAMLALTPEQRDRIIRYLLSRPRADPDHRGGSQSQ